MRARYTGVTSCERRRVNGTDLVARRHVARNEILGLLRLGPRRVVYQIDHSMSDVFSRRVHKRVCMIAHKEDVRINTLVAPSLRDLVLFQRDVERALVSVNYVRVSGRLAKSACPVTL